MKIGVFQMNSVLDYQLNLERIRSILPDAKKQRLEALFLPECFYSMSNGTRPSPYLVDDNNEHYQNVRQLAVEFGGFLLAGSAATNLNGQVVNRALNFDGAGNDLGHYDKIHLFSCDIKKENGDQKRIDEADIYTPGNQPKIINAGPLKIGLGICFDVRYPEQSREYVKQGANLLTFSSAFTVPTGKAHWHTLCRARAIENQCFVVAPAQWGRHNERIQTYGHSLIIDPWGEILADAGEGERLISAELDLERVAMVRAAVKVF